MSASASPHAPEARLIVGLLGPFELKRGDGPPLRLPKKAQALLAYLAMQRGRPASREQLATLLWGNSATEQARQGLRQCLAAVRNTLGAEASKPIIADTASVLLAPSDSWEVDVPDFEAACQSKAVADLERAGALFRDEFLAGLQIPVEPFNDWLTLERQRLTSLRLDLLERLGRARAEAGDMEGAIAAARQLNALDPLREVGHRQLMRLLAASGNRSAALKQHERCTQVLREELGIAPEAETERLAEAIRAGRPRSSASSEAAPPAPTPPAARLRRHRDCRFRTSPRSSFFPLPTSAAMPARTTSSMGWWRTSPSRSAASPGCSSSPARRPSP